jgi:hypothetical protein
MPESAQSLAGQTLRWKFEDGPTAGTVYEHTFRPDGTVVWRDVSGEKKTGAAKDQGAEEKPAAKAEAPRYASFEVTPKTHLVSYLSHSGYTLTVALNFDTGHCYGIASNSEQWFPLEGRLVTEPPDPDAS